MANSDPICETELITAYIDGDLEPASRSAFEEHIKQCQGCSAELRAQRQFMCELNSVMTSPFDLPVPANFARVVAVHAESDMRGLRDRAEHKRALRFCIILALIAFALLGATSSKLAILNAGLIADKAIAVLGFFGKGIFNAAAGSTVIFRMLGRGFVSDSRFIGLAGLFLVALAIGLLSLLISRYHRTRLME